MESVTANVGGSEGRIKHLSNYDYSDSDTASKTYEISLKYPIQKLRKTITLELESEQKVYTKKVKVRYTEPGTVEFPNWALRGDKSVVVCGRKLNKKDKVLYITRIQCGSNISTYK